MNGVTTRGSGRFVREDSHFRDWISADGSPDPNLSAYLRDMYQVPGVADTVDLAQIKRHHYGTHPSINPTRIVPAEPVLELDAPHGRDGFGG